MSIDSTLGNPTLNLPGADRVSQGQLSDVFAAWAKLAEANAQHAAVMALPGDPAFVSLQNKLTTDPTVKESLATEAERRK